MTTTLTLPSALFSSGFLATELVLLVSVAANPGRDERWHVGHCTDHIPNPSRGDRRHSYDVAMGDLIGRGVLVHDGTGLAIEADPSRWDDGQDDQD